ncbi:unnamed protein product [Rhizophagus irregularis]|nr:unnamed protein product [Rhizophagus irregularis]
MLSNTRQLKLTKPLYVYKPVISLRYVSNDIQRSFKTSSNIQEQQSTQITDININNILSQTDKLNAWSDVFAKAPQNDASNSKLSRQDLKRYSKQIVKEEKEKHILEGNLEMEINQGVRPKEEESQRVINEAGVHMLPDWLYKQVFNRSIRPVPPKNLVEISMEHLKEQGYYNKKADTVPNINQFKLPKLCGKTISEHFWRIGEEQARPIRDLAMHLVGTNLPTMPTNWILRPGWTRYEGGKLPNSVDYPNESILCFNTKTFDEHKYPLIACAASPTAWYSWISPRLLSNDDEIDCDSKYLIPVGNLKKDRLIVGHNVGIDRIRIKEEYHYAGSNISFLDTQSLHIAVSGICSRLKNDWNKYNKAYKNSDKQYMLQEKKFRKIYDVSSVNSLYEVYNFYCNQYLNKPGRDVFIKGTFKELQDTKNLQQAIVSCASNVEAAHQVFQKLFPKFIDVCPHPVSFAGVVQMGSMFLTTNKDWEKFIINSEAKYKSLNESIESTLGKLAGKTLKERNHGDQWVNQLDWRINSSNHPEWYNKIYNKNTNKVRVTALSQIAPILLKLKWLNYPVYYSKQYGWMYRVPIEDKHFTVNSELCKFSTLPEHVYYEPHFSEDKNGSYYCIPNKNGRTNRCGTPLAKKYICDFENGTLQSDRKEAEEILKFHAACTYWMSIRDRIKSQLPIYSGYSGIYNFGFDTNDEEDIGIILPKTIAMGTITRRVVENTWATATNPREYLIGSEQKSMIKAPKGYKIVGADVDSQEMWISSLISDAEFGFHGATGLGLMMLQGSKSEGTDLHSETAKILGITRDDAKVFNYSRLYGAGIKTILGMLENSFANINVEEAEERVKTLFKKTKGQRYYSSNINGHGFWFGGSETYLANRLEEIATSLEPLTPVLRCGITNALKPANADRSYMTSRVNWVVQSSGVDYLHLLLVSMKYLIKKYNINARFMLSVHDDVRYLVKEDDAYRAALALQISNLWTRAMFSHMLGIEDLPLTTAFFSGVDIDHVYRKEVDMKCNTISHQIEIEPGTRVSIQEILKHQRTLRCTDSSLCDESLEPDFVKDLGSYDSFLWKAYQPKDDKLFLKAQSMSSTEEIKKLCKESNSPEIKTYTNQLLNKKKRVFEPYVETPEANSN